MIDSKRARAVVKVGDGRGFIVDGPRGKVVITSAHCLPHLPPPHAASSLEELRYGRLIGPIGTKPTVGVECLFADPVADIAVLGSLGIPMWEDADAFDALVNERPAFSVGVGPAREEVGRAWLLTIARRWSRCEVQHWDGDLLISKAWAGLHAGMSGSPVVSDEGTAIGAWFQWGQASQGKEYRSAAVAIRG
jgi:hypothetical protein